MSLFNFFCAFWSSEIDGFLQLLGLLQFLGLLHSEGGESRSFCICSNTSASSKARLFVEVITNCCRLIAVFTSLFSSFLVAFVILLLIAEISLLIVD